MKLPKLDSEDGFTLVELLIVVVIIGILAAIAIPIFVNQQGAARDAAVVSDNKNAQIAVQTAVITNPFADTFTTATLNSIKAAFKGTSGVNMWLYGTPKDYCLQSFYPDGGKYNGMGSTTNYFYFVSATGQRGSKTELGNLSSKSCYLATGAVYTQIF